jgi:hypothetical protein
MEIFIFSFVVFSLSSLALALGLLLWGKPIRGGCAQGGLSCQNACGKQHCPNKSDKTPNQTIAPPEA